MDAIFIKKIQLFIVCQFVNWQNFILSIFNKVLFSELKLAPKNILIYRIGNIGDIVCSVPALIAIRRAYPKSKIILLTSPGDEGALGAKELLTGVWHLDELRIYFSKDIDSFNKKINFIRDLRKNHYDLFIQLPNNLANSRTLLRNLIFAKTIKAISTFGFKIRTVQLFKKTQVDYLFDKTEAESLLDILKENGVPVGKAEFDFNVLSKQKDKVKNLLKENLVKIKKGDIIAAISPGGKREANQWPVERFAEVAKHLQDKYNAKIAIIGGERDVEKANIINKSLNGKNVLVLAGELDLLETLEFLRNCSFLICGSTGPIHLAAAIGIKTIGLYNIRDVYGRWFPYGNGHKILYHKFLNCDYKKEECVKKSIDMISVEEVKGAVDEIIKSLNL